MVGHGRRESGGSLDYSSQVERGRAEALAMSAMMVLDGAKASLRLT